jgi:hypothetical protein
LHGNSYLFNIQEIIVMSTRESHGVKSFYKFDLLIEWSVRQRIRALAKNTSGIYMPYGRYPSSTPGFRRCTP